MDPTEQQPDTEQTEQVDFHRGFPPEAYAKLYPTMQEAERRDVQPPVDEQPADQPEPQNEPAPAREQPDSTEVHPVVTSLRQHVEDLGLDDDAAENVVTHVSEGLKELAAERRAANDAIVATWAKDTQREFGGARLKATQENVTRTFKELGSPGLVRLLAATGLVDHPDVVRFADKVGALLGAPKQNSSQPNPRVDPKTAAKVMYGAGGYPAEQSGDAFAGGKHLSEYERDMQGLAAALYTKK